jgi:nitrogen fixation protein NifU and related proteins
LALPTVPLDEIYRDVVLDHYRSPRGKTEIESPDLRAEGQNPLCGDEVTLALKFNGDRIEKVFVKGQGCSISVASGSMLAELLPGKTREEADRILAAFKALMHGRPLPSDLDMGDLDALEGVNKFPVRVKCALLAWTTLEDALSPGPSKSKGISA